MDTLMHSFDYIVTDMPSKTVLKVIFRDIDRVPLRVLSSILDISQSSVLLDFADRRFIVTLPLPLTE